MTTNPNPSRRSRFPRAASLASCFLILCCVLFESETLATVNQPPSTQPPSTQGALPSAEKIIKDHIKASGGREARAKIKNRVAKGRIMLRSPAGQVVQGRFEKYNSRPGKSYFVWSRVGGAESDTGCDGETAWEITPSKGPRIIEGAERESKIRDSIFDFELQWLDYFKEIHCTGIEVIDERPCYRVVMVPPKGPPETRFFDVESSLLIGEDVPSATDKSKVTQVRYGKYETVDGVALPREIRQSSSTLEVLYAIQSYEQNAEIPAYKLELPAVIKVMKKRMEAKPPEPSKPGKPG